MAWSDLIDPNVRPEKTASGFKFTEGPVYSRRGYLLFTDIPNNRIHKWQRGQLSVYREDSNGANGLTFDHQGRLLACEIGRVTRTEKDGKITAIASGAVARANDIVYCIDGSIYFTDPSKSLVYQITKKGELRPVAKDGVSPNGVALSPNQQKLYIADSKERVVRVYEIDSGGLLQNGKKLAECRCDGLKTDEGGNVWVASSGGVAVFDSSGAKLGLVETPEEPSNCCWGPGFRGLYITARTSVYFVPTKIAGTRTY